jgi:DNA-directed RNA polymerase subunit RPC12/RpoP
LEISQETWNSLINFLLVLLFLVIYFTPSEEDIFTMRLRCNKCHKPVSSEVPEDTVVRAWIECPECIEEKKPKHEPEPHDHCHHDNTHHEDDGSVVCNDCGKKVA